jgi:hypothetical protein
MSGEPRKVRHSCRKIRIAAAKERRLKRALQEEQDLQYQWLVKRMEELQAYEAIKKRERQEKEYEDICFAVSSVAADRNDESGFYWELDTHCGHGFYHISKEKFRKDVLATAYPLWKRRMQDKKDQSVACEIVKYPQVASRKLLDYAIGLSGLRLPAYVVMFILDFLPGFAQLSELKKITLLQNVAVFHRDIPKTRLHDKFLVRKVTERYAYYFTYCHKLEFFSAIRATKLAVRSRIEYHVFRGFKEQDLFKRRRMQRYKELATVRLPTDDWLRAMNAMAKALCFYEKYYNINVDRLTKEEEEEAMYLGGLSALASLLGDDKLFQSATQKVFRSACLEMSHQCRIFEPGPIYFKLDSESLRENLFIKRGPLFLVPRVEDRKPKKLVKREQCNSSNSSKVRKSTKEVEAAFGILKKKK